MIRFGTGGNSQSFYDEGHKTSLDMCQWLQNLGLQAYEYECSRGVRVSKTFCTTLAAQAKRYNIKLSIHAPYYINLASTDSTIVDKSRYHILKSLQAANWMEAERVVFHPGARGDSTREEAYKRLENALYQLVVDARQEGLLDFVRLCPETMGKINMMGHLQEVLDLCKLDPSLYPAIDFAHLYALGGGNLRNEKDFGNILDKTEKVLGRQKLEGLHIHFSPIEYTKAGEKRHHTLAEKEFGPDFYYLAQALLQRDLEPVIICESAGTQAEDALEFQRIYHVLQQDKKRTAF